MSNSLEICTIMISTLFRNFSILIALWKLYMYGLIKFVSETKDWRISCARLKAKYVLNMCL